MREAQILHGKGEWPSFEYEILLSAAGESDWVLIPDKIRSISVTLSFTGDASGKIQTTTDGVNTVKNGSPTECDWPFGEVNSISSQVCRPVTAMRAVMSGTGTLKVSMRAQ